MDNRNSSQWCSTEKGDGTEGCTEMRVNDETTKDHIDAIEADNDALRVQVQLLEEEVVSLKVWMQQKFADTEMAVA